MVKTAQDIIINKEGGGFNAFDPVLAFTSEELEIINDIQPEIKKAAENAIGAVELMVKGEIDRAMSDYNS